MHSAGGKSRSLAVTDSRGAARGLLDAPASYANWYASWLTVVVLCGAVAIICSIDRTAMSGEPKREARREGYRKWAPSQAMALSALSALHLNTVIGLALCSCGAAHGSQVWLERHGQGRGQQVGARRGSVAHTPAHLATRGLAVQRLA